MPPMPRPPMPDRPPPAPPPRMPAYTGEDRARTVATPTPAKICLVFISYLLCGHGTPWPSLLIRTSNGVSSIDVTDAAEKRDPLEIRRPRARIHMSNRAPRCPDQWLVSPMPSAPGSLELDPADSPGPREGLPRWAMQMKCRELRHSPCRRRPPRCPRRWRRTSPVGRARLRSKPYVSHLP